MGTVSRTESDLWEAAAAGDARSFTILFERHRDRVLRHVRRTLTDRRDAEDVAAAAFFELWRRRRTVRVVDGSVLPWLLVTAGNLARNSLRALRRYRATLDALPRSAMSEDPAELAATRIEDAQAGELLRLLQPVDAALVALTVLEGYTVAAAAEAVGLTAGAGRVRLHRAKARLRLQVNLPRSFQEEEAL